MESLDHPIRPGQPDRRNRQADLLGRFEIDHQLKPRRLLDGQIGRFRSFQDLIERPPESSA
jgi:hypothetical protein